MTRDELNTVLEAKRFDEVWGLIVDDVIGAASVIALGVYQPFGVLGEAIENAIEAIAADIDSGEESASKIADDAADEFNQRERPDTTL